MLALTDAAVDVLLVDDREDGLVALEAILHDQPNYNLIKVRSGREAIAKLGLHDFGVILLDVQMPELDGFQTAKIIRSMPRFQKIPIIFVTAINKDDRYIYRGYEAGAVDYIFKPVDPIILRSKVSVFAELHLQNRQIREQAIRLSERDALEHKAQIQSVELENLRRYGNLADAIPHIILRASGPGALEYHNDLWASYTGMKPSESAGIGWQSAIDSRDLSHLLKMWRRSILLRQSFESECRLRQYDGSYRWHWLKFVPEIGPKGEIIAWLATCTDIHDRKTAEENFKVAQKRAEAANDAKTHFLANMSHEIRTPLNAIMGFTELVSDPGTSVSEKAEFIAVVRRNGRQLLKIVDEILDISKVEAGGIEIEKVETKVFDLLNDTKALMQIAADKKKIDLIFDMSSRIPSTVITDSTRLRQILLNLIGNAIKFTEKGSVKVSGRFRTSMEGNSFLLFDVIDTGLGIDEESRDKIFQPFSQADSSTTRLYGGTGLGLPLSRKLARVMGGDIRLAQSALGVGSKFEIEIRVDLPPNDQFANAHTQGEPAEEDGRSSTAAKLKGKKILLVEDAEDNQFLIAHFLSRTGAIIDVANNGQEGIDKALANHYEVVLMDIQMPVVDGYQATSRLRQAGYTRPIIALTAHALVEEREKCLRNGCSGHLTKPINRRQLIERLAEFVGTP